MKRSIYSTFPANWWYVVSICEAGLVGHIRNERALQEVVELYACMIWNPHMNLSVSVFIFYKAHATYQGALNKLNC